MWCSDDSSTSDGSCWGTCSWYGCDNIDWYGPYDCCPIFLNDNCDYYCVYSYSSMQQQEQQKKIHHINIVDDS